jgi:trehalose/maltose transport system permease protein
VSTVAERAARPGAGARGRIHRLQRTPAGRFVRRLPFYFLIALIFVYALFPFYWALRSSFTPDADLFSTPVQYFPSDPTLHQFSEVLSSHFFLRALLNSTIVAGGVTLLALVLGSLAAFALGRFRFRGRSATLYLMLSMTTFPQIAILGALYTMITGLHVHIFGLSFHLPHVYNTLWALIVTYMIFTLPLTVWVLTSFMRALPRDLEEAAYVDGATPLQVFYRVLLPLIAPGLVTTGLLAFIAAWNEFLYAVSFEETPNHYTVPLAMVNFVGKSGSTFQVPWGQLMAATVVVTVPLIVLTLLLQRRILAGLTAGAVKG